jgi:hypothetical protein
MIMSPIGQSRRGGIIFQDTILGLKDAEARTAIKELMLDKNLQLAMEDLSRITGKKLSKKQVKMGWSGADEVFGKELQAWESANPKFAEAIPKYAEIERSLDKHLLGRQELIAIAEKMGSEPRMTAQKMREFGVKRHIPHMVDRSVDPRGLEVTLTQGLIARGEHPLTAHGKAVRMLKNTSEREGFKKLGSLEYNRNIPGTIGEITSGEKPIPLMGPFASMARYNGEAVRRIEQARIVGWNGELKDTLRSLVEREGGDGASFNSIIDHLLGNKYYEEYIRRWAQNAVNLETVTKLTFAGIPNAFQQLVNNPLQIGWKPTVRGIYTSLAGSPATKEWGAIYSAQADDWLRAFNRVSTGATSDNWTDQAARTFLKGTFFSGTEGWNKAATAHANNYFFRDTFARAAAGNLRGKSLDQARHRLAERGVKLDPVLKRWRQNGGSLEDAVEAVHGAGAYGAAIFKGVRETQFQPIRTYVPRLWATPYGRVFAQFKTFALNQGILLRDSVMAEAAQGNIRPLAYLLGIYPLAGELVGTLTYAARAKPDSRSNGAMRAIEDGLFMGGLGIVSTMVQAAAYNRPMDALAGPTITDTVSIAANVISFDIDGLKYQVTRQPVYQATRNILGGSVLGLEAALEYAETVKGGGAPDETVIRLDDLLTR